MKPVKYSVADVKLINLKTKRILKYPAPNQEIDLGHMTVSGRYPEGKSFERNKVCSFIIYVLEGHGKIYAGDEIYEVGSADVVFVPKQNKYAMKGDFQYLTIDYPAYRGDQSEQVH